MIQYHSELVEECRSYVQLFIDQQMDWTNIETVISLEQKKKNELAQHIQLPLNLKENKIKVLLEDFDDYEEITESASATETGSKQKLSLSLNQAQNQKVITMRIRFL